MTHRFSLALLLVALTLGARAKLPHPDYIVVVIDENKGLAPVGDSAKAPPITGIWQ